MDNHEYLIKKSEIPSVDGPCQNPGRFKFTFMAEMFYHPPNSAKGITTYTFIKQQPLLLVPENHVVILRFHYKYHVSLIQINVTIIA